MMMISVICLISFMFFHDMQGMAGIKRSHPDNLEETAALKSNVITIKIPQKFTPYCIDSVFESENIISIDAQALDPIDYVSYKSILKNSNGALLAVSNYFDSNGRLVYRVYNGPSLTKWLQEKQEQGGWQNELDEDDLYDPVSGQKINQVLYYLTPAHSSPFEYVGTFQDVDTYGLLTLACEGVNGNNEALCSMGKIYAHGYGVDQNDERARVWYRRAARAGCLEAMLELAKLYTSLDDYRKAYRWYTRAIQEKQSAQAMYHLGVFYEKGRGVEQNFETALKLYGDSADGHFSPALYYLGTLYANGGMVTQDIQKATHYLKQAIEYGDEEIERMAQKELCILKIKAKNAERANVSRV